MYYMYWQTIVSLAVLASLAYCQSICYNYDKGDVIPLTSNDSYCSKSSLM